MKVQLAIYAVFALLLAEAFAYADAQQCPILGHTVECGATTADEVAGVFDSSEYARKRYEVSGDAKISPLPQTPLLCQVEIDAQNSVTGKHTETVRLYLRRFLVDGKAYLQICEPAFQA